MVSFNADWRWAARDARRAATATLAAILGLAVGLDIYTARSWAQQEVPGFRPGREGEQFRPPVPPPSGMQFEIPEGTGATIPEAAHQVRMTLQNIVVSGATVFPESEFVPLFKDMLGKEVTLADIYKVAFAITTRYRERGYVLSRAVVPAQRIDQAAATVEIRVIEGYVDKIEIEDKRSEEDQLLPSYPLFRETLRSRVQAIADRIVGVKPLDIADLERALLLANDLAGVTARAVVRPSPANQGASSMIIVIERKTVDAGVGFNNHGSKFTGPNRHTANVAFNSLAGSGERIAGQYVRAGTGRELKYYDGEFTVPIFSDGLQVAVKGIHSTSVPGHTLRGNMVESQTQEGSIGVRYPIIRSRAQNLYVEAGALYRDVQTNLLRDKFQRDRIRAATLTARYDLADAIGGVTSVSVTGTKGLGLLHATSRKDPVATRPEADPNFFKITADVARRQNIIDGLNLVVAGRGQTTPDPLLSSMEFSVGGREFGRAYDFGEISGDRGVAAKVELQLDGRLITSHIPDVPMGGDRRISLGFLEDIQLYGFYDMGWTINRDNVDKRTDNQKNSLESAGVGVRFNVLNHFNAEIEAAKPLTRQPAKTIGEEESSRGNFRLLFNVSTIF